MLEVLSIISPIFVILFFGYLAVSFKIIDQPALLGIGRFVLYFALPALIVVNVGNSNITEVLQPWFFLAYGIGSLITYTLTFVLFKFVFKNDDISSGIKGMGSAFSNSGFVGFPLLLQAFDNPPITAFAIILIFENIIMMPLVLGVLEYASRDKDKSPIQTIIQIFAKLIKNPIILAILVSIPLSVLDLTIPLFLNDSLEILSKASAGAALFFIGGSLANNSIKGNYRDITLVSMAKLIIHPAMVGMMIWILPSFDTQMQFSAILFASVPMMSIYPIIGSRFGFASFCSSTIMLTTIISFFTISSLLMIYR